MGSQSGAFQQPEMLSMGRQQGSLYNLTLDEAQNQLAKMGKPLASMNLDELLQSVWNAEANQGNGMVIDHKNGGGGGGQLSFGSNLHAHGNLNMPTDLSSELQRTMTPSPLMGNLSNLQVVPLSDTNVPRRIRVTPGDAEETIVERKQRRVIKNRQSAARSRARKQAYINELEKKVSQLEDKNEKLKKQQEKFKLMPIEPPLNPKCQLRRTSSASALMGHT